eukprot:6456904-Amphidinium_carterae.1
MPFSTYLRCWWKQLQEKSYSSVLPPTLENSAYAIVVTANSLLKILSWDGIRTTFCLDTGGSPTAAKDTDDEDCKSVCWGSWN